MGYPTRALSIMPVVFILSKLVSWTIRMLESNSLVVEHQTESRGSSIESHWPRVMFVNKTC